MKKNKIIILSICVVLLVVVLFLFIFGKSKTDNKYIIQTDMKWLTMHNDGGSHTNIYYEVDFNKNIVVKKEEVYKANLGGTPETNKSTIYEKELDAKISSADYKILMKNRNLKKFRPLKNSFTKKGDKIILAKALGITPSELAGYIKTAKENIYDIKKIDFLTPEKMELLKIYIYRHGSKDDLVRFLDYELTQTKDLLKTLYTTLQYYSGGVADYFIRPIHRMDNKTLIRLFDVIDRHIKLDELEGRFTEADSKKNALNALARIYEIQQNSKFINAIKTYKVLH